MFLCTICALEHLCTNRQLNICSQTVDGYFGRQFAVRLCTNGSQIFRTSICCPFVHKRLTNISERKGKENSMKIKKITFLRECKQLSQEKSQTLVRYVGQQTLVRCYSAQPVAWADLYPFAVQNCLLCSVYIASIL